MPTNGPTPNMKQKQTWNFKKTAPTSGETPKANNGPPQKKNNEQHLRQSRRSVTMDSKGWRHYLSSENRSIRLPEFFVGKKHLPG